MTESPSRIKLFVAGRRKPGMTRQEHAEHRYNVHAAVTAGGDKALIPICYSQNHIIDSALGVPRGTPNSNHPWLVGVHEIAECDFRDSQQLKSYFSSQHVRDFVQPDIPAFADFGCLVWMVGQSVRQRVARKSDEAVEHSDSFGFNAYLFLAAPAGGEDQGKDPSEVLDQVFAWFLDGKLEGVLGGELFTPLAEDDLAAYFGGNDDAIPNYSVVLKLDLIGRCSFQQVREAQLRLENKLWVKASFDLSKSFIALTKDSVVFSENKEFDPDARPDFDHIL